MSYVSLCNACDALQVAALERSIVVTQALLDAFFHHQQQQKHESSEDAPTVSRLYKLDNTSTSLREDPENHSSLGGGEVPYPFPIPFSLPTIRILFSVRLFPCPSPTFFPSLLPSNSQSATRGLGLASGSRRQMHFVVFQTKIYASVSGKNKLA